MGQALAAPPTEDSTINLHRFLTDRHTASQSPGQTDTQTDRQTDLNGAGVSRAANRRINLHHFLTNRKTDRQPGSPADRHTDRHTDTDTNTQKTNRTLRRILIGSPRSIRAEGSALTAITRRGKHVSRSNDMVG